MFLSSLLMWDSVRRTLRETKKEAPNRAPWNNAMEFLFNLVFIELSIERGTGNSKFCRCMNTIWGDIGNWYRLLSCQLFSQDILLWIHYSIDIQFIWHDKNQEHHRVYTNDQDSQIRIAAKWPHKQGQGQRQCVIYTWLQNSDWYYYIGQLWLKSTNIWAKKTLWLPANSAPFYETKERL